jgi:hypothetical protein
LFYFLTAMSFVQTDVSPSGSNRSKRSAPTSPFWFIVSTVAVFCGLTVASNADSWNAPRQDADLADFTLPDAWASILSDPSRLTLVLGSAILVLILATEITWRELREDVIDDLSRDQWFVSKLFETLMVCLFYEMMVLGTGALFAMTNPYTVFLRVSDVNMIAAWSLGLIGFASLAFFIATTVRRAGPAFSLLLIWVSLGETAVQNLLRGAPFTEFLPGKVFFQLIDPSNFSPVKAGMDQVVLMGGTYVIALFGVSYIQMHWRKL